MSKIVFPSLNLEFNISKIAFKIGSADIYWYAVLIVSGIVLSLFLMYFTKKKYGIKYEDFLEIFIFVLVGGVIGARLFYVIFNLEYYLQNISQIFNIQNGGLAIYGGIIAGSIIAYIACKLKKINFFDFADFVVPYLALSQGIGRIGNFINQEAYGMETTNFLRMRIETESGLSEVHPCFLYEMIGCFAIFIILKLLQRKQKYKGEIFGFYLVFYGIIRFFVELLRADSLTFGKVKVSCVISVILAFLGISLYIKNMVCRKKSDKVNEK